MAASGFTRIIGPHPAHEAKRKQRAFRKRQARMMRVLLLEWKRLVKETTWESPIPSPDALIIAQLRNQITMDIGWIHYPSGAKGGEERLQLRLAIFKRENLDPERIKALFKGVV